MDWPRLLAYITGAVDQELLLRNEYLEAENRILKGQIKTRLQLSDAERATLAEIAHQLGRKVLEEVAVSVQPYTILGWDRKLISFHRCPLHPSLGSPSNGDSPPDHMTPKQHWISVWTSHEFFDQTRVRMGKGSLPRDTPCTLRRRLRRGCSLAAILDQLVQNPLP